MVKIYKLQISLKSQVKQPLDSSYKMYANTYEALLLPCYTLGISQTICQTPNTMNMLCKFLEHCFALTH
jgi:hypothetical protein